jgi:hypothetical protein
LKESNTEATARVISEFDRLANLIISSKDNLNDAVSVIEEGEQENQELRERSEKLANWIDFFKGYIQQKALGNEDKDETLFQRLVEKGIEKYQTEDAPDLEDVFDSIGI